MRLEGVLSLGEHDVLAEGAEVTIEGGVVKDGRGKVVGRVLEGRVENGQVYAVMEIDYSDGTAALCRVGPVRLG